jgi:hypothetical protein
MSHNPGDGVQYVRARLGPQEEPNDLADCMSAQLTYIKRTRETS